MEAVDLRNRSKENWTGEITVKSALMVLILIFSFLQCPDSTHSSHFCGPAAMCLVERERLNQTYLHNSMMNISIFHVEDDVECDILSVFTLVIVRHRFNVTNKNDSFYKYVSNSK